MLNEGLFPVILESKKYSHYQFQLGYDIFYLTNIGSCHFLLGTFYWHSSGGDLSWYFAIPETVFVPWTMLIIGGYKWQEWHWNYVHCSTSSLEWCVTSTLWFMKKEEEEEDAERKAALFMHTRLISGFFKSRWNYLFWPPFFIGLN